MTARTAHVLITDDEAGARKMIRSFLDHHFPNNFLIHEADGVQDALNVLNREGIDMMFLDIEMEDGTGFDLLDLLPEIDFPIIFTTAHDGFAIKAFRYNAVDYLLKPIDPDQFVEAVEKARLYQDRELLHRQFKDLLKTSKEQDFDRITLNTNDGLVFAETRDILRIETYGNYTFVFMQNGDRLLVSRNLKEFEEMLPEPYFFRIHQSHMVNTTFVKKLIIGEGDHVIMTDGINVPVSRRRKDRLIEILK